MTVYLGQQISQMDKEKIEKTEGLELGETLTESHSVELPWIKAFGKQLSSMVWRNYLLARHYWVATLAKTVGAPFLLMLLLFGLQIADWARQRQTIANPPKTVLNGINSCIPGTFPCINILFHPDTAEVRKYLSVFAKNNAERTGQPAFNFDGQISDARTVPSRNMDMVFFLLIFGLDSES